MMPRCCAKAVSGMAGLVLVVMLTLCLTVSAATAYVVDFRQSSNKNPTQGNVVWINSILQQNNSTYYEGMSTLQRVVFIEIPATATNVHRLTLKHQANKSTSHAYDFITSWDQGVQAGNIIGGPTMFVTLNRCGDNIGPPGNLGAICEALHTSGYSLDVSAPDAMGTLLGDNVATRVGAYEARFGNRTVRLWGNAAITSGSLTFGGYSGAGDQYADYTLTWTSASTQIVIEMAGHLASGVDPLAAGIGYGAGKGSAAISGGPYHFKLDYLDTYSLGSQDNQIKGADILLPQPACHVTPADTSFCAGGTVTFAETATGGTPPYSWCWQKEPYTGGCLSTGSQLVIADATPANSGNYRVIVTDANTLKDTCYAVLTVHDLPVCSVTGGLSAVCEGATTQWCAPVAPAGLTYDYAWTGPGGFTSTGRCITIGAAGQYSVTITDNHGCQSSCSRELTLYASPVCSITGDTTVCAGFTTQFCAVEGMSSYSWTGPGGFADTTRCITTGTAGTYSVTITDSHGCQSSCSRELTVYALPPCTISRVGAQGDTVCPCSLDQDPIPTVRFCGPAEMSLYTWSISGGGTITTDPGERCVEVQASHVSCDTSFTLTLTVEDGNLCTSTCYRTVYVVDKTPPELTYCPPDTVIDCEDLGEFWPSSIAKVTGLAVTVTPGGKDNCDASPSVDYADTGGRPTNWMPRVEDSWGSCGEDTTVLRKWYVRDFCGNVDSSCVQAIAIQDTVPPLLVCAPGDTVPCGAQVVFDDPGSTDNCDPERLVNLVVVSTDTVPGPDPGQFTHTRCWAASDSCQNLSPVCCQSILVEACPEEFCTYTQGGWGSDCPDQQQEDMMSTQPGCVRDHYFTQVFPNGVRIGDPAGIPGASNFYAAEWTTAAAVLAFLPADGTPKTLRSDAINPITTRAGIVAGQILALRMNREYSCAGIFSQVGLQTSAICYGTFIIPGSCGKFAGLTVDRFLAVADSAVGGKTQALTPFEATMSDVNATATCLNQMFDNCDPTVLSQITERPISQGTQASELGETAVSAPVPDEFAVKQSYPNPFNPNATIVYALPADGRVTIEVYDIVGRKVATLIDEQKQAGYHSVVWFGQDAQGKPVASGVYFCKVQFGSHSAVRKLLLLK